MILALNIVAIVASAIVLTAAPSAFKQSRETNRMLAESRARIDEQPDRLP